MIRLTDVSLGKPKRIPRASGDDPIGAEPIASLEEYSPRERG